eukprot:TRINITY_DN17999_c0_g1_i1.p1 TRINITY_DN17999_c0_g1~~TRINITY_DN17999_c0_g1_i1.p1  ORF type:complete len:281 (+),score=38.24 TRINITY_DN17999_c0_g1_i1:80-922(+)
MNILNITTFVLSLLLCWCVVKAAEIDAIPGLPESYSVIVEKNLLDQNKSIYGLGYYDYSRQRFRIEENSQESSTVKILLFASSVEYALQVGTTNCTTSAISSDASIDGDFFVFAGSLTYKYIGQQVGRGIRCDVWMSQYSGPDPFTPGNTAEFNLSYFFALPDWNIRAGASDQYRIPIRAEMHGGSFDSVNNVTAPLNRFYEFLDFFYGTFDDTLFAKPYACTTIDVGISKGAALTAGVISGIVVALFILGVAVLGRCWYMRIEEKNKTKATRLHDEAML